MFAVRFISLLRFVGTRDGHHGALFVVLALGLSTVALFLIQPAFAQCNPGGDQYCGNVGVNPCTYGTCVYVPNGSCNDGTFHPTSYTRVTSPPVTWYHCYTWNFLGYSCNEVLVECGITSGYSDSACIYDCTPNYVMVGCAASARSRPCPL